MLKTSSDNAQYRSNITLCRQAMEWSANKNPAYTITPAPFNSTAADYAPVPIGPGQVVFTSDRNEGETKNTYLWTGRAFSDLFVSKAGGLDIAPFNPVINSGSNEGTVAFSPDGNTLVFIVALFTAEEQDLDGLLHPTEDFLHLADDLVVE